MKESIPETIRAVPPVGLGGMSAFGIPLPEWLTILGLIYTVFIIIEKLPVVIARLKRFYGWVKGVWDVKSE